MNIADLERYATAVQSTDLLMRCGVVEDIVGLLVESSGPKVMLGEVCRIVPPSSPPVLAESVGFKNNRVLLMPYGDLTGISPGSLVEATGHEPTVRVGRDMLGRTVDALGFPLDHESPWKVEASYPISASPVAPLSRENIDKPFSTGIKAIDGMLTLGDGQRVGIFSGSGVGKSTLMGMIARGTSADVNVIGLIGERGREVKEFLEHDLGDAGLARSVIVVATSDEPALLRIKAANVATAIAEFFRDQGLSVLLMMDSVTRYCMALREVGLAIGEPPTTRGYTPSVFASLPKLLERAGKSCKGSITGIYTVLVEGDDMDEPIADAARGILDGHIVLSRNLAETGHYPAIDVLASVSRLSRQVMTPEQSALCQRVRTILSTYRKAEDLINIGAYVKGSNSKIDESLKFIDAVNDYLRQDARETFSLQEAIDGLKDIFK
jgi:flagellum-specific ATP synthase